MRHFRRRFEVLDVGTREEMAQLLKESIWPTTQGFRLVGETPILLLNDSVGPSSEQEYAVYDESRGAQIESIVVSYMDAADLRVFLDKIGHVRGKFDALARHPMPHLGGDGK